MARLLVRSNRYPLNGSGVLHTPDAGSAG